jgi:hypothetical protein
MRSYLLSLALAGCATVSSSLSQPGRTIRIDNDTPDALVVRVDGVRIGTVLNQRSACVRFPDAGRALTVRAVGGADSYAAPVFVPEQAASWTWHIRPHLGFPGSTLDLRPSSTSCAPGDYRLADVSRDR